MGHICAKEFLDTNFNQVVINKISNFHEIAPNFTYFCEYVKLPQISHIHKNRNFLSIIGSF